MQSPLRPTRAILWVLLVFGGLPGLGSLAQAQTTEADRWVLGRPVVRTISPQSYDGVEEGWDVAQDGQGLLYLASSYGLQQYDGARWRTLPTANETTPWAIARDTTGTLYVGARNELGRYRPDSLGRLTYRSLLEHVPGDRPVGNVRSVTTANGAVYFGASTGVLRWADGRMTVLTDTTARALHACRDTAYVRPQNDEVRRVADTSLMPVPGAQRFDGAVLTDVLPAPTGGCQFVTAERGRFARTDTGWTRRPWPGGPMEGGVTHAVRGPGGALAVATDTTLRLVGPAGRVQNITASGPLPNGQIRSLHVSERGALWVATGAGAARVAWPDPVSVLDDPAVLRSGVRAVARHDGRLTVATDQGVWRRRGSEGRIIASVGPVSDLLSTEPGLLIAANDGLHAWRNGALRTIADGLAYALHRSPRDSSVIFVSRYDEGLLRLRRTDGRWRVAGRTDRFDTPLYTLAQDTSGALWFGTGHRGVWRLGPPLRPLDDAPVARFDTTDGLPDGHFNYTLQHGEAVRFITDDGLFRRDGSTFVPDDRFAPVYADKIWKGWPYVPGPAGEVWIDFGGHKVGVAQPVGDSMQWTARPFRRLADVGDLNAIRPAGDSVVWFGGSDALIRYDRRLQPHGGHAQPFRTLIRGVRTRADSLLYGGDTRLEMLPAAVGPDVGGLRFQFGATSYEQIDGPTHNWDRPRQYRWRLDGVDEGWTDWTTEPRADYTGLPPGIHTLHVQARNLYQVVGRKATLSFTVRPPWYRTWWAYGGYGLLALLLVGGAVQWRTRRLRRRQEELEQTVAERTEEVRRQRNELEEQAERLRTLDDAKSRFFANLSHEFRTPLTLIRGPLQQVREHLERGTLEAVPAAADEDAEQLALAERNAARLQRLVDQLLGLARMEAGTYDLAARPTDLGSAVTRLAREFEPLAERAGITLIAERDEEGGSDQSETTDTEPVYVDREALERIVSNLLSNAIKFTPEGGRVSVTVRRQDDAVEFTVEDTGPGIPEAEQDAVFNRFAQVDDTATREQEGAGIGLALSRDLVELHGGTIHLDSVEGEGTTVTVRLPRGPEHLSDDQIAAARPPDEPTSTDSPEEKAPPSLDSSTSTLDPQPSPPADRAPTPDTTRPPSEHSHDASDDQSKIVLVVDDNADVRRYVCSVLTPDFSVIEARTGDEGVAAAREHLPDVILADVMMPEMDGHEMTRRLKDEPETEAIPVIMVTARAETQDEVTGLQVGADDYVTKPFDADVLRQRVGGVLTLQQRLRRRLEAELQGAADEPDDAADEERPEIVQEARRGVREHLADPDFDVEALAEKMAMSRSTLYRKLRDASDITPSALITQVRIEHAQALLRDREPVTQVAYAVGYDTLSTFSRVFREEMGTPPSTYADE